jgi:Domain of unknown function (DUF5671)
LATNDDLQAFVKDALARGTPRPVLADVLRKAGWQAVQVDAALRSFADVEFPIPVPTPVRHLSARDAFLYLVLFSTLYLAAYQLGHLVFLFIEQAFPDAAAPAWQQQAWYVTARMRWAVAALIVSLPVFLYLSALTRREVVCDPAKRQSAVRRWLTYLTLFVAASVLIGDVITLIYSLLGGELTVRFVLKALTVAVIAGSAFSYYLWDVRGDEEAPRS